MLSRTQGEIDVNSELPLYKCTTKTFFCTCLTIWHCSLLTARTDLILWSSQHKSINQSNPNLEWTYCSACLQTVTLWVFKSGYLMGLRSTVYRADHSWIYLFRSYFCGEIVAILTQKWGICQTCQEAWITVLSSRSVCALAIWYPLKWKWQV